MNTLQIQQQFREWQEHLEETELRLLESIWSLERTIEEERQMLERINEKMEDLTQCINDILL